MTIQMTEDEKIRQARREYAKEYRKKNKKKIAEQQKLWREQNPEKVKAINRDYWLRKAERMKA